MKVGDRILINSREHPWFSHTGKVVGCWDERAAKYAVRLDEAPIEVQIYDYEAQVIGGDEPFVPAARMPCS